jgi:hypothetical protein
MTVAGEQGRFLFAATAMDRRYNCTRATPT